MNSELETETTLDMDRIDRIELSVHWVALEAVDSKVPNIVEYKNEKRYLFLKLFFKIIFVKTQLFLEPYLFHV